MAKMQPTHKGHNGFRSYLPRMVPRGKMQSWILLFPECAQCLWFISFNLPFPTSSQLCFALFAADFLLTYYIACVLCTKVVEAKKEVLNKLS